MSVVPVAQSSDEQQAIIEPDSRERARQVAALIWKPAQSGVDVLLVTSRISGHWLLPKGWPMDGMSAPESALQEAFEEAGAWGPIDDDPIGTYCYDKVMKDGSSLPCSVDVFSIRSSGLLDQWPEMTQRKRRWYSAEAAASHVSETDLARFLGQCEGIINR